MSMSSWPTHREFLPPGGRRRQFRSSRRSAPIPLPWASLPTLRIQVAVPTGSAFFYPELMSKRLELLKAVVPSMTSAGVLLVRGNPSNALVLQAMGTTAKALGVGPQPIEVRGPPEYDSAFSAWTNQQMGGVVISDHGQFQANLDTIVALAAKHRLSSWSPGIGCKRRAHGLWGEFFRVVSPRRHFRGQDFSRARNLAIFQSNRPPNSSWSSI